MLNDNHLGALIHFRHEVITTLAEKGFSIKLIAPVNEDGKLPDLPSGVEYIPISMNRTSKGIIGVLRYTINLIRIFRKEKPDIVINYTIKADNIWRNCLQNNQSSFNCIFAGVSKSLSELASKTIHFLRLF